MAEREGPGIPDLPDDLRRIADLARRAGAPFEVPPDLEAATMERIRAEAAPAPRRRALAPVAALVAAALVGALATFGIARALDDGPRGVLEVSGTLQADAGTGPAASVQVRRTDLGREVHLSSDALPVLPAGRFYELWFVAPDDAPATPHRISAGTFHPDAAGHSDLTLHAAVNPALFPVVSVTAEDGDGDPAPGAEVARLSR